MTDNLEVVAARETHQGVPRSNYLVVCLVGSHCHFTRGVNGNKASQRVNIPGNKYSICGQNPRVVKVVRTEASPNYPPSQMYPHWYDRDNLLTRRSESELQSCEVKDLRWKQQRSQIRRQRFLDKFRTPSTVQKQLGIQRQKSMKQVPALQSEEEATETESTTAEKVVAENIVFRDEALSQRITMGDMSAGDYDADADDSAGLGEFLSRPVRIASINWPESTFTQTSILPWHLYFNTAQIKKKLDNYGKISCRLHLKFVINASPFYYGSLRACYFPLIDQRSTYTNAVDQIPFSQTPGVYLEPQNMSTAEMVLPFLWPRNWLEATSANDFQQMGRLQFLQYANLRSANGVSGTGITVAVYAWAEDVRIMGPTTVAALQSDEYEDTKGTVSGPATAIADVADMLVEVPGIGEYAQATSIGARAVAGIAKLFGYSNPPMIDDVKPVQTKTFHAFANVETRMPIDKLSVDPKNEVTISSKVAGVDEEDPLAFSNLLTRESFLQGTLWSNSQAVDTLLWSALVNPGYIATGGGYNTSPPMSYFSRMARFWRGSLVYKFRFIKTKYHKGRVIISWDPNGDISANPDTETVTFSRVVDLAVEDEVEVVVPYKNTAPWSYPQYSAGTYSNGASPSYTYDSEFHNGCITVRVQNLLTGPAASPQIDILCYVRAGEDFMLAVPQDLSVNFTSRDPLGVIQSEEEEDNIAIAPVTADQKIGAITTGEIVCSLRPLLHRASLAYQQFAGIPTVGNTAGTYTTSNHIWRVPYGIGRMDTGYGYATVAAAGVGYNFSPNHPIDWTLNCFVGYRGSTNIHVNVTGIGANAQRVSHLSLSRYYANPIIGATSSYMRNGYQFTSTLDAPNNASRQSIRVPGGQSFPAFPTGQAGITVTNTQGQPACSANIPQYLRARFLPAFTSVRNIDPKNGQRFYDEASVHCQFSTNTTLASTTDWPLLSYYYSAGVDFQPIFFLCTPRIFATALPNGREVYP